MKKVLFFCIALCAITMVKAQETLTLNQCLQMAIDNNLSLKISRNEVAKGKQTISELLYKWLVGRVEVTQWLGI